MLPDSFLLLDALPIAPNGKVDRQALPRPGKRERGTARCRPPRTTLEQDLTAIWSDILSCRDIGTDQNFFELGGHSLAAVRLASAINRLLHVDIGVADIFATPTIAELARVIDERPRREQPLPTIAKLHEGTEDPPIYLIGSALFRFAQLVGGRHRIFGIDGLLHVLQAYQASPSTKFAQLVEPHLSALIAHMRSSRCVLVGYSFTGLMAFEIAHQLQKRGTNVELVVLLDTRARHLNAWQTHWLKWHQKWSNRESSLQFWRAFRAAAAARLAGAPCSPAAAGDNDEWPWPLPKKVVIRLQQSYRPQRLETRGVMFTAETDSLAALGWGEFFARGFKIVPVPGDHVSMVRAEQNLQRLAREMRKILQSELQHAV
jgi:thioesterase domain-containing protein